MKLVIDISKDAYEQIKNNTEGYIAEGEAMVAIRNGEPLPEGHGDLIDRDKLDLLHTTMSYCSTAPHFIWVADILDVEPTVKADKKNIDKNNPKNIKCENCLFAEKVNNLNYTCSVKERTLHYFCKCDNFKWRTGEENK